MTDQMISCDRIWKNMTNPSGDYTGKDKISC